MDAPTSGIEWARRYHEDVIGPILEARMPGMPHAVGRLGSGSDVLGLDDPMSRDHDWGLRLTLLIEDDATVAEVDRLLEAQLPDSHLGRPIRFPTTWNPTPSHQVEVRTSDDFASSRLGVHPDGLIGDPLAWLSLTGQSVLEVVAGPVFADQPGRITAIRQRLAWYPDDVWLVVLAAGWRRLAQELPMVGRCAGAGDDLGSRVVTARLVRDAMHLACLIERAWPPYPKWLGTRFARLDVAGAAGPPLAAALAAADGPSREEHLVQAITALHDTQRVAGLPVVGHPVIPFWDRPYRTVDDRVVSVLVAAVEDPSLRALPIGIGSIEQWADSVDVLTPPDRRVRMATAWRSPPAPGAPPAGPPSTSPDGRPQRGT